MASNVARIVISVDNKGALRAVRETGDAVEESGTKVEATDERTAAANDLAAESFGRMKDAAIGLAGLLGLGAVAFGLKDVVQAGVKWQENQASLRAALKGTGEYSVATMKKLNVAAATLATHGGFSAEENVSGLTQLVGETGNATAAMKLNAAATNLARFAHFDYAKALKMVEGAEIGQGRAIQKLTGVIVPVTQYTYGWSAAMKAANPAGYAHAVVLNKMATAQEILGIVQRKYGNQTAIYSKTVSGAFSNIRNVLQLLIIRISTYLLPVLSKIAQGLAAALSWIMSHFGAIKGVILAAFSPLIAVAKWLWNARSALAAVGIVLSPLLVAFAAYRAALLLNAGVTAITGASIAGLTVAEWASLGPMGALSLAWDTLTAAMMANPTVLIVAAIALLIGAFVLAYTKVKWFRDAVSAAFNAISSVVTTVVDWIGSHWKLLAAIFLAPFLGPATLIIAVFGKVKRFLGGVIDWIKHAFGSILSVIEAPFKFLSGIFGGGGPKKKVAAALNREDYNIGRRIGGPGPPPAGERYGANDAVTSSRHRAGTDSGGSGQPIILHHQTVLSGRVIAQETVHYVQKRAAVG